MQIRTFAISCWLMTCCLFCGPFNGTAAADGLDTLQQRTFAVDLKDYTWGNGAQVAVGYYYSDTSHGSVLTSTNGVDWKQVTLLDDPERTVNAVTFFNGSFIVAGTDSVHTSTDGSSWTRTPETAGIVLNDFAVGNNLLVAVGSDSGYFGGTITKSTDGVTWTPVASGLAYGLNAVAYCSANSTFAAVGNTGVIYTYQSTLVTKRAQLGYEFTDVVYGNGIFVTVGNNGAIATSSNTASGKSNNVGTTWTLRTTGTLETLTSVAYGNGTFVVVGADLVLTSPDGITWTQRTFDTPASATKIRFDGTRFIAVGLDGVMLTSVDGVAWTTVIPGAAIPIGQMVTNGSIIVATGGNRGAVLTSPDGARWTARYLPGREAVSGLAYGNGLFVGIGRNDASNRVVMRSADGITWTRGDFPDGTWFTDIAFGNDTFVIVTAGSSLFTSTDGVTWIPGTLSNLVGSVTFNNGNFIAVGSDRVYTSPDGFNWTDYVVNSQTSMGIIVPGNVTSAALGLERGLFTSSGYKHWRERTSPFASILQPTISGFGNNTFIAPDGSGGLLTSNDGKSWGSRTLTPPFEANSTLFFNNSFILTGLPLNAPWGTDTSKGGMIFQSATMAPVDLPAAVPEIDFFPNSINYGGVKRGNSLTTTITIVNSWTGALSAAVQLEGPNITDYSITGGSCGSQNVLAPDDACTIEVSFTPTTAFTRNAQVVITSNDPVTPVVTIPLTGSGIQPVITPPSPLPVNLGTVVYPMFGAANVIIRNNGNDILQIASASLAGSSEFSVFSEDCTGAILDRGGLCVVQIFFEPQSGGPRTATVTIRSNDPDYPVLDIPIIVNGGSAGLNQIRINGSTPTYYSSLQAACDQAVDGDTIEVEAIGFQESITTNKRLTLKGGFDSSYSSSSGLTSLQGLTIMAGSLTVENLVIL